MYCATSPDVLKEAKHDPKKTHDGSGRYYADCGLAVAKGFCNVENANRLWGNNYAYIILHISVCVGEMSVMLFSAVLILFFFRVD